jgi:phosphoglycerate dehydrogenase-like enzyme
VTLPLRVLVHYDRSELFLDAIRERHPDIEIHVCTSYDALADDLTAFAPETMFTIKFENRPYPRDAVMAAPSLRWVQVGGAGIDHLTPWDPNRLTVSNSAGVAADVMAQYTMAAILSLTFELPRFMRAQVEHRWAPTNVATIEGRCVAVIGLGHTGAAVARRSKAMGLRVVGVRAHPRPMEGIDRVYGPDDLHAALGEGDYIVVSTPRTDQTHHLIDAPAIAAMRPGAFLIDVSRGGVVDGEALIGALRDASLAGAALDVFEHEPLPADSPFWDLDNVIVTPHSSSIDDGWERRSAIMWCDNIDRWLAGEPLDRITDPTRGY